MCLRKQRLTQCALLLIAIVGSAVCADDPAPQIDVQNLALSANIAASSEHEHLPAWNVADGRISEAGAALGELGSWAVLGEKEKGKGEISFAWKTPNRVAEIVYFGRCAWQLEETFKEYEVYAEGNLTPIAKGELQKRADSQRIRFEPVETAKLTLKFLNSHGGSNPGANEILLFTRPVTDGELERFTRFAPNTLLNDHVVLQQQRPIRIWGTAADSELITVEFRGHRAECTASNGQWQVVLPPEVPGPPAEIRIRSAVREFIVRDVLVGEVWVASGQSNMEMPVDVQYWPSRYDGVTNAKKEVEAADYPQIRMFYVPRIAAGLPKADSGGQWRVCSPKTVGGFSAVAYFFGRQLHKELNVPIGLVDCSWGATYIDPWTSLEGLRSVPQLAEVTQKAAEERVAYQKAIAENPQSPPGSHQHQPTRLFNGMVHRLTSFPIRGAIWYQGEGNVGEGMQYFFKMNALISGWRQAWGQGEFPFLYVQLAPYDYGMYKGSKDPYKLPALWEAQSAALSIRNTGMAVTTDISEVKNIHPPNKQEVGHRLARWALAGTYGKNDVPYCGPQFKYYLLEPGQVRVIFDPHGRNLESRDGKPLTWFALAGTDQVFHPAEATIDGDAILVRSTEVKEPLHVRFGWNKLAEPNLANEAGLPAIPFRTDNWTTQTGLEN